MDVGEVLGLLGERGLPAGPRLIGCRPRWSGSAGCSHDVLRLDYEPWREARLTVDTAGDSEECLAKILWYCHR